MATKSVSARGVLVCTIAALFCAYQFMLQGAPAVMVPQLMSSLDLDIADIGLLTSSFLYLYLICQVPAGYLADRCSAPVLLVSCSLLMALACYWFSVAGDMGSASLARALMGVATSPVIIVCMTLVSRWFPERYFPPLVGMLEAFALIGGGMGPLLIPGLMEFSGWRGAMEYLAMAGIALAICFVLWVRSWPEGGQIESKYNVYEPEGSCKSMDYGCFLKCCLYGFGLFAMITCFGGLWGIPYLNERFPGQESAVADVLSLIFAGAALGAPLLGWLASATGRTLIIMVGAGVSTLVSSSLLMFCPCCLAMMGVFCFMAGLSTGGYILAFSLVKKLSQPRYVGLLLACVNGSLLLAGPVLQPVVGFILDARSTNGIKALSVTDYQVAFIPLLICQLLALIAAALFPGRRLSISG